MKLALAFLMLLFSLAANAANVLIPDTDLICRLSVGPTPITLGQSFVVNWSAPGVTPTSIKLDGVEVTGKLGSKMVTPTAVGQVTIVLECVGPNGVVRLEGRVTVQQ